MELAQQPWNNEDSRGASTAATATMGPVQQPSQQPIEEIAQQIALQSTQWTAAAEGNSAIASLVQVKNKDGSPESRRIRRRWLELNPSPSKDE